MRLKNLGVSRQLNIGLGTIAVLVLLLEASSLFSIDLVWSNASELYDHALMVRRAVEAVQVDVLSMHRDMAWLVLAEDALTRDELIRNIDALEGDANRQLEVLYQQYHGSPGDIDAAADGLAHWKSIRAETIRLLQSGELAAAQQRVGAGGICGQQVELIMGSLQTVSNTAQDAAEQFYQQVDAQRDLYMWRLAAGLLAVLLLLASVSYLLRTGILPPLRELTRATDAMRRGQLQVRSSLQSDNELGALSASFNRMAEMLETEIKHKDDVARVSAAMFAQDSLLPFSQELLKQLVQLTGSQMAAVFLLQGDEFEPLVSIGFGSEALPKFTASLQEGELGLAMLGGRWQHLSVMPTEATVSFTAVGGVYQARELITIPILHGPQVVAAISLCTINQYDPQSLRLVDSLVNEITARLNSHLAAESVKSYSERLEKGNRELEAQAKELLMQKDELTEQNIELEMQKKQLDEASRLKSSFLSNMSHELRTPLNSVIALSSVLGRRLAGKIPKEEHNYLDVIERNGKLLLALVNDLLDLSRIESGREEVNLEHFNIGALVSDITDTLAFQAEQKGISLQTELPPELPAAVSDPDKCRHILQNIIGNAIKFTDQGYVRVSIALVDGEIQVAVCDTGIGIAPSHLEMIFDEFRQVDETSARKKGGTGLGLAIAKKYADLVGASISVQSTPGEGSCFVVKLPQAGSPLGIVSPPKAEVAAGAERNRPVVVGKHILLVEDSEPVVIQVSDILTEQGYRVSIARSGREALALLHQIKPDGLILDLMMPEMDGFEVLKSIRSLEQHAHIPVLILTAKHITRHELSFLKSNHVFQLVQKGSVDKQNLLCTVRQLVSSQMPTVQPAAREIKLGPTGKPLILAVEDNPDNLTTIKALLGETYDIAEAQDGRSGVERAQELQPALVLMDISLPAMDGFQALQALRCDDALADIPVVALTARATTADMTEILARGFDGYLSKPIDGDKLHAVVRRALNGEKA
jgi:signal transduction histidine kinase/CheY-like chemotaxis protein/HAMP domain-containing protein